MNDYAHRWRIYDRVTFEPSGCWSWRGSRSYGYPMFFRAGRRYKVARFIYESFVAPIPAGRHIHHVCRNRGCVNFGHIEVVTPTEHRERHRDQSVANMRVANQRRHDAHSARG